MMTIATLALSGLAAPLVGIVFVIASCTTAITPDERHAAAVSTNTPVMPNVGAVQHGRASWYGDRYHGRKTASGERFDQNAFTAAHRTLPFGSTVRVQNQRTGRSVEVRINDRGPFGRKTRIIDVSKAAARELGMLKAGVIAVELTVVSVPTTD